MDKVDLTKVTEKIDDALYAWEFSHYYTFASEIVSIFNTGDRDLISAAVKEIQERIIQDVRDMP